MKKNCVLQNVGILKLRQSFLLLVANKIQLYLTELIRIYIKPHKFWFRAETFEQSVSFDSYSDNIQERKNISTSVAGIFNLQIRELRNPLSPETNTKNRFKRKKNKKEIDEEVMIRYVSINFDHQPLSIFYRTMIKTTLEFYARFPQLFQHILYSTC